MPPKIYNIKDPLNLERLRLANPTTKNGSHFIKTLDIDNPIYFLGPKCFSKNGFVKSGKKIFCDFVFSNEDSEFLAWLENLEESVKKFIYMNRETWFETPLDEHDIESSMSSPFKPYKSGKYFIVRANVPTALDKINIKVYDDNENETDPENIKENTKVLAVLEFQGIRCNVRSFQFEIELKQLLIVEPEKLFEKCIIPATHNQPLNDSDKSLITASIATKSKIDSMPANDYIHAEENKDASNTEINRVSNNSDGLELDLGNLQKEQPSERIDDLDTIIDMSDKLAVPVEIMETDFPLEDITDSHTEKEPPLRLKSRNDVYYKLYKEMRQRAKEAKREALANYLEAKRIKNTYFLENLSESESDKDDLYQ
jgi:hypothetical protein